VYRVLIALKIVESDAVLATRVTVLPETVYKPNFTRLWPVVCVEADATEIELMVVP
jgi:hypothetical protein